MDWRKGHVLGRGSTATVSLATTKTTHHHFAVKSTILANSQPLRNEHHLFTSIITPSPYIITYFGQSIDSTSYNLFLEYIPSGTLTQQGIINDINTLQFYMWRILKGLQHLHKLGIVHGDIKPANILLGSTGPKISDFGCAREVNNDGKRRKRFGGTPMYMAPEVARGDEQCIASDVWSFGCTVIEMITGESPLGNNLDDKDLHPVSVMYKIGYCDEYKPEVPNWVSIEVKDFLEKCLRREPNERWSAAELLQHPFVKRQNNNEFESPDESSSSSLFMKFDSCNEIHEKDGGCGYSSPTSVLEQQQDEINWESTIEGTMTISGSTVVREEDTVERRIKGLSSQFDWELDDNDDDQVWITVR